MNLCIEADSLDELHRLIPETMRLLMFDLLADNELDAFLRERGWQAIGGLPARPQEDLRFQVPWELIVPGATGDSERRAS